MNRKAFYLNKIKFYLMSCFVSFTIADLVLSVLNIMDRVGMYVNLEIFAVCFCIALVMFILDVVGSNLNRPVLMLLQFADVVISVLGLGGFVFGWFPISLEYILLAFMILTFVYIVTCLLIFGFDKITENEINKKISERKGGNKNGGKNN